MQEQFWEILSGDHVASESRLGHKMGTGHLAHLCSWGAGREHPSPEVPGRLHGLRFSPWMGDLHLEQGSLWTWGPGPLPSPVLGGESCSAAPFKDQCVDMAKKYTINQTEGQILLTRKAARLPSSRLSSLICCPDISLQWKRADRGIGKPRCTWYIELAGWPERPCFLAVGHRWPLGLVFSRCRCSSRFYILSKLSAWSCFLNLCVSVCVWLAGCFLVCRIFSSCDPLASHCSGFSCCGVRALEFSFGSSQALERRISSGDARG